MSNKFFALVQELQDPADSLLYKENKIPTDIWKGKSNDSLYRILKISNSGKAINMGIPHVTSFLKTAVVRAEVVKLLDAKDGEIKWEVLN